MELVARHKNRIRQAISHRARRSPAVGDRADAAKSSENARLIALNMALDGTPREETARYVGDNFELSANGLNAMLNEVYERAGGDRPPPDCTRTDRADAPKSYESARLIALNMALDGTPREETARYVGDNFELSANGMNAMLDEVYEGGDRGTPDGTGRNGADAAKSDEGARLIALDMALNGTPREETARFVDDNFDLPAKDVNAILYEVYDLATG